MKTLKQIQSDIEKEFETCFGNGEKYNETISGDLGNALYRINSAIKKSFEAGRKIERKMWMKNAGIVYKVKKL